MGDCPGAGSGDWRDYEQRSSEEIADDEYKDFKRWINRKRFEIVKWRVPVEGEYFVPDDNPRRFNEREILKAECCLLYGSTEMVPLNFESNRKYYVVKRRKSEKNQGKRRQEQ